MQIGRPQLLILITAVPVRIITDSGDIVGQGIQPYINHMPVIEIYRNSPFKGGSGHTQILKPRKEEIVHHFVFAGYGLYKFRILINMLNKLIRILAHFKEIGFFLGGLYFPAAVRAFAVHQLGLRPEGFTGSTVKSFIMSLVNISLIIQALKNLLYLLYMIIIRGTDKFIIGCSHQIPEALYLTGYLVHIFLRGYPCLLGF